MSFAENLQRIRKEKHLSQEELAEMLDVSRQAVSKWEQGTGYPEVEKLLVLSHELNISLDSLMAAEIARGKADEPDKVTGTITISSPREHVVVKCRQVMSSPKFKGGKNSPNTPCLPSATMRYPFGDRKAHFWVGTQTRNSWKRKFPKYKTPYSVGYQLTS